MVVLIENLPLIQRMVWTLGIESNGDILIGIVKGISVSFLVLHVRWWMCSVNIKEEPLYLGIDRLGRVRLIHRVVGF
jgi:hypothetical protein